MASTAGMSASVTGRVVTSAGRSSGQHGGEDRVPMTTSAACGSPVQQAALTETMLEVPTLSTTTKPDLPEQVDVVGAGGLADPERRGEVADAHRPGR